MTIDEARDALQRLADTMPELVSDELATTAATVASEVASQWPRDTGLTGDAWTSNGPAVVNDVGDVSYVHDGLAFTLVPTLIDAAQADLELRVDDRVQQIAEGRE